MAFYVVVEGHGETRAAPNLLYRLSGELGYAPHWAAPMRINVLRELDAHKAASLIRPRRDVEGLLVLRDCEDQCPVEAAPEVAGWFKRLGLPFPVAVVLFYREYETLFLPCINSFAGRPLIVDGIERAGVIAGTEFTADPESVRDAKGVISAGMPFGRTYKETTDQLAFTQMLDFEHLRQSDLACFGTLERSLHFLLGAASAGEVFPLDR